MTLRYINPADDAGFNSSGISTVRLQVPSGQYWIPRLIKTGLLGYPGRLSVRPFEPRLITKLYHGTPSDTGPGAFVDSTVNTFTGDVTSILNGTVLQPGEWLTAVTSTLNLDTWTQGLVYLEFDGLTTGDIVEASQFVASSVPGLPFRGQLAYPMAMPPMADRVNLYRFNNPGSGNTVNLIADVSATGSPENLFIYQVSMLAFASVAGADGALSPIPPVAFPLTVVDQFMYYNPVNTSTAQPVFQDYRGLQMLPGGLQWIQLGSAAANAVEFAIDVAFRFMAI